MKALRQILPAFFILIMPTVNGQKTSRDSPQEVLETTACQVLKNPSAYNNRLVKVRGSPKVSFEHSYLASEGCDDGIWFTLADGWVPGLAVMIPGKGRPGGNDSKGRHVPPIPVRLIRDSDFEKFRHYMNVKATEQPCVNDLTEPTSPDCDVDRVTATFTGRIDSVSKALYAARVRKSSGLRNDSKGFGHMGLFDAQIVVKSVENVVALDSFGREKP